jgi:ribosomal protein S18 acetylase RimI-like enzyme
LDPHSSDLSCCDAGRRDATGDPRVRLVPMSATRYPGWAAESITGFAEQQVASGSMPAREAREYAEREFDKLLPEGLLTREHHIWSALDGDVEVGYLWIRVREQSTEVEGYVFDVAVRARLQRRGYGRALMLAGEEAARDLGADTMRLTVFGHNRAAQRLYDSLGYETSATQMSRRLDSTEPLALSGGPALSLRPMNAEQFDRYRAQAEKRYAESIASSGMLPLEEARAKSVADFGRLLPAGIDTPEQFFWTGYDGDAEVGLVWLNIAARSDGLHAFGYDLVVREDLRRKGYGRAIVVAAESLCRDRGVVAIGLNVFGHNHGARSLYEQLGFEVTATLMRKPLIPTLGVVPG